MAETFQKLELCVFNTTILSYVECHWQIFDFVIFTVFGKAICRVKKLVCDFGFIWKMIVFLLLNIMYIYVYICTVNEQPSLLWKSHFHINLCTCIIRMLIVYGISISFDVRKNNDFNNFSAVTKRRSRKFFPFFPRYNDIILWDFQFDE